MSLLRSAASVALGASLALGFLFACADTDEAPALPQPAPLDASPLPEAAPVDAAVDVDDASVVDPVVPGQCSPGGFCYVTVPVKKPLIAVSASSVDDAWMIPQESNAILRWDGTSIKQVYEYTGTNPASITFRTIWAEKKDNVWAVATDSTRQFFVVRYAPGPNGGPPAFREVPTGVSDALVNVWVTPASDALWVVSGFTYTSPVPPVRRFREDATGALVAESFNPTTGPDDTNWYIWQAIWGFGPDDVYVGGQTCVPGECDFNGTSVIAHYDGSTWSITKLDSSELIGSLRGTAPGQPRQLWYHLVVPDGRPTYLVPVTQDGGIGAPLLTHPTEAAPDCSSSIGEAVSPTAAWLSHGLIVCRWNGTKLEVMPTSINGRPVVYSVSGIWARSSEDAWIVGQSVSQGPDFPATGFAAWRKPGSAAGGK